MSLAPKAFDVLRHLVEHAGQLVTQDELLEALWPNTFVQPEVLRKYILDIRKVLEDPPKNPIFIQTLPKRGYQFIAPVQEETSKALGDDASIQSTKLVGRESPLASLEKQLATTLRGQRQVTFVTGEAGIGKSSLLDAFERKVSLDPSILIARGQCVEGFGGKEAYYPILEALGQLIRRPSGERVVEILANHAPTWLVQFPSRIKPEQREALQRELLGATRERMVREICESLEMLAAEQAVILLLEDLQWVDDSTLDVLSAVARRRGPSRLLILATYRPVEVILHQGALKALKQDLLVHRLGNELALERLGEVEIQKYLQAEFPGGVFPQALASLIFHHSDGNPLFMVAMVEQLVKLGHVSQQEGRWTVTSPVEGLDPGAPETLLGMLEAQLEQLTSEEQRILRIASVAGRKFSVWAINTTIESEATRIEEVCDGLATLQRVIRRGGIQQLADGSISAQYEFKHALYREVLYRQLPVAQRCQVHRALADRLESVDRSPAAASELALHFEQGIEYARAIPYLIVVSENAGLRYAHRESIKVLRHALELLARLPQPRPELEVQILERVSDAHYALGEMEPSAEVDQKVAHLAARAGLKTAQVNALTRLARPLAFKDLDACVEVCQRALEVSRTHDDPLLQARAEMLAACWRIVTNGWQKEDAEVCAKAREAIRQLSDAALPAYYEILHAHVQCTQGDYEGAYQTAQAGIPWAIESRSLVVYLSALSAQTLALLHLGRWGQLREVLATAIEVAEKNGNDPWLGIFQSVSGWLHLHAGDFNGARDFAESLMRRHTENPAGQVRTTAMITAGFVELESGDRNLAREYFTAACNRQIQPKFFLDWYWRMIARLGLCEVGLASGDLKTAAQEVTLFMTAALATADPALQAIAWEVKARVAIASEDWKLAEDCVGRGFATLDQFEVPIAGWRVHATAAALFRLQGQRDMSEIHRRQAETILRALCDSFDPGDPLRGTLLELSAARAVFNPAPPPKRGRARVVTS